MKFRVKGFEKFTGGWKWHVLGPQGEIRGMYVDWNLAIRVANKLAKADVLAQELRKDNSVAFWQPPVSGNFSGTFR